VSIEPKIKYEGFGGGPLFVGAWGPGPLPPLNPALELLRLWWDWISNPHARLRRLWCPEREPRQRGGPDPPMVSKTALWELLNCEKRHVGWISARMSGRNLKGRICSLDRPL